MPNTKEPKTPTEEQAKVDHTAINKLAIDYPSDWPIYFALAGSVLASAVFVPVIHAAVGPAPMTLLLWASAIAGLLVGMLGLLAGGIIAKSLPTLRDLRKQAVETQAMSAQNSQNRLAMD